MRLLKLICLTFLTAGLAAGCGLFGDKKAEEKPQQKPAQQQGGSAWDSKIGDTGSSSVHADRIAAAQIDTLAMGGPASSPKIADYLTDPSAEVRNKAVKILSKFGKKAEPALPKIFEFLRNVKPPIRAASAKSLAFIGHPAAKDHLKQATKDPEPRVRVWAHAGLARLTGDCQDHAEDVAKLLKEGQRPVPHEAAEALGKMNCANEDVIDTLVEALGAADEYVVVAAARALGSNGQKAAKAVPPLTQMLESKSFRLRQAALLALAKMGTKAAPAVGILVEMLKDPSPRFRELAAHTLGSIGPLASAAVDRLKKLTMDPEATVQAAAKRALAKILPE
jgi:HEAT repeat protein